MTTRDYYGAINYDKYAFVVKRYDVYRIYNGNKYVNNEDYYVGTENINEVKRPHEIIYYRE